MKEHFTEVAKSRDVEVLAGKNQFVEFSGLIIPMTKSGDQLSIAFIPFQENRLPFSVRVSSNKKFFGLVFHLTHNLLHRLKIRMTRMWVALLLVAWPSCENLSTNKQ